MRKSKDFFEEQQKELLGKISKDSKLGSEIESIEELKRAIDGDRFGADKVKVPYVTAEPIYEKTWSDQD